jgi:thiol:disulfide interchange protein DsbA
MNLAQARGILTCLLLTLAAATKADDGPYVEGVHYKRLADASAAYDLGATEGRPSVVEVFWYGCGHCYAFDPMLNAWVAGKADTLSFARTPMIWDDATKEHARLFHATRALGLQEEMHTRIFDAIHKERNVLLDEASIGALFTEFGVDAEDVTKTFSSFGVDAEVRKAETRQREMFIPSVPALIVNGIYLINSTNAVPTHQAMLDVADYLLTRSP